MYQNVKRTCRVLFWLINPIVLWRSRCRRRRRFLSSLLTLQHTALNSNILATNQTQKFTWTV